MGAIAAGNTAVLKPSESAPAVSSLLAEGISTYLDTNAVKVIQGGSDVAALLLELKWDHIFFTGEFTNFYPLNTYVLSMLQSTKFESKVWLMFESL